MKHKLSSQVAMKMVHDTIRHLTYPTVCNAAERSRENALKVNVQYVNSRFKLFLMEKHHRRLL